MVFKLFSNIKQVSYMNALSRHVVSWCFRSRLLTLRGDRWLGRSVVFCKSAVGRRSPHGCILGAQ